MSKYDEMVRGIVSKIRVFSEARSEIQKSKQEFWRDEMARLGRSITKALEKVAEPGVVSQKECEKCGAIWSKMRECVNCDPVMTINTSLADKLSDAEAKLSLAVESLKKIRACDIQGIGFRNILNEAIETLTQIKGDGSR